MTRQLDADVVVLTSRFAPGLALLPAKVVTEGVLFVLSYGVQRALVFPRVDASPPPHVPIIRVETGPPVATMPDSMTTTPITGSSR